jgi:FkbM family methyltransferase
MALSLQYDEAKVIRDYFGRRPRTGANGGSGVIVDVGAQFGTSFRDYLSDGWRALAFEPDATKFDKLAKYEGRPNFTLLKVAVGDVPRDGIPFFTSPESTGISSLVAFRDSHAEAQKVRVVTLADTLREQGIRSIDFLKIDTEGFDLQVLRGHDWSIRPEVILTEFDEIKTRHLGHTYRAIGDLLLSHGYAVWCSEWAPIERYGAGHAWRAVTPYPCDLHHPDGWGNFVAVRSDAGVELMRELLAPHTNPA